MNDEGVKMKDTGLPFHLYCTNMMAIAHRLRVFGIDRPVLVGDVRFEDDIVGIGTMSVVTPTSSRHRSDDVGVWEVNARILTTGQWRDKWIQALNMAAQANVNVRVLRTNTHWHEFAYAQYCNINPDSLIERMQW